MLATKVAMAAPATRVSVPRRRVMIRAEEESSGTQAPEPVRGPMGTPMRGLSFDMNERAGIGFQAEDSAGQTNIFAVEPRAYIAEGSDVGGANVIGAGAAAAIALVVVGFIALSGGPVGSGVEELKGYKTASEYAAEFRQ